MTNQNIASNTLTEGLKQLAPVLSGLTKAKQENSRLIALCDLTGPTIEAKSTGRNYFDYNADALRDMLDTRDVELHQAAQIIAMLCDKAMDVDSLVGNATADLDNSIDYLVQVKRQEVANHD